MTPGSCSTAIHILLEEVGEIFEVHLVNLLNGDHHQPEYLLLNPKGTIPTLVKQDGNVLTDFQSIAWWIAKNYPKSQLMPNKLDAEITVLEVMSFAVNTIHGQGYTRIFTTDKFTPNEADFESVKAQGRQIVEQAFAIVNDWLEGRDYVVELFSIADAALFYVEFWADRMNIPLPENCRAHYQRMLKRPAVRLVLAEEGYATVLQSS